MIISHMSNASFFKHISNFFYVFIRFWIGKYMLNAFYVDSTINLLKTEGAIGSFLKLTGAIAPVAPTLTTALDYPKFFSILSCKHSFNKMFLVSKDLECISMPFCILVVKKSNIYCLPFCRKSTSLFFMDVSYKPILRLCKID